MPTYMPHETQPAKPVLSPATFEEAVLRLRIATDDELAEWDKRLPAELERFYAARIEQEHAA